MKKIYSILATLLLSYGLTSCQQSSDSHGAQINTDLSVDEFEKVLKENPTVQLLDVRTIEEFEQGHLEGALNYDVNSSDFENKVNTLDKTRPVLLYCLSGGRSSSAASFLEKKGFEEVHNMKGGLMKWNSANKSLNKLSKESTSKGLTTEDFKEILRTEKFVLVDYNAKWCVPCKRMAPWLASLAENKKDKVILLTIDADQNKEFLKEKGVESLPVLELYKNGKLIWKHEGEIEEQVLLEETKL